MATDPVAWGADDGLHTPELYRVLAAVAGEREGGVLGLNDCKVVPLAVPGAGVNVNPGVAVIPCRIAGMVDQFYVARIPTQDTAGVTATGAGSGRTDLEVYVVDPPPANPNTFVRVLSNVGAGGTLPAPVTNRATALAYLAAQGLSAEPLGLVVLLASTATVNAGNITDLRKVARPRKDRSLYTVNPGAVSNLTTVSPAWQDWTMAPTVDVPSWATRLVVSAHVRCRLDRSTTTVNGTAAGYLRVRLGGTSGAPVAVSQSVAYDEFAAFADGVARVSVDVADIITVPASLRGQTVTMALQGNKSSGNKNLYVDTASFAQLDYEWQESAA
jgi:hypothetical protein